MRILAATLVILFFASNVYSIILPNGIINGPNMNVVNTFWILHYVGCYGSWRIYYFKRWIVRIYYVNVINPRIVHVSHMFLIVEDHIPRWWIWDFWCSLLMYAQNASSVNEFLRHSWDKVILSLLNIQNGHAFFNDVKLVSFTLLVLYSVRNHTSMSLGESLLKSCSIFYRELLVLDWCWCFARICSVFQYDIHIFPVIYLKM